MNRDEWIQKLKKMGLSGYEAQVYLALLGETRAPASRVVRKSGVPQSKVYGALSSLVDRGFAEQVLGDVKLYRGIPPQQAFENYKRKVEDSLTDAQSDMVTLSELAPESPGDDPGSLGIRLVRSNQVSTVVLEALDSAEEELLMSAKSPLVLPPDTDSDLRLIKRGVKLRTIMETDTLRDAELAAEVERNAGVLNTDKTPAVRFTRNLPLRFMVIDRKMVMIELKEEDGSVMGLVIPNRGLAENMRLLFQTLWNTSHTLDALPERFREPVAGGTGQ